MTANTKTAPLAYATQSDPRWVAVVARHAESDGKFYYSVKTTGVYCRPSCAARLPRPENVRFHSTSHDAELAGFRPCLRCKPDLPVASEPDANDHTAKTSKESLSMINTAVPAKVSTTAIRYAVGACSLGTVLVAHGERGICAILLGDDAQSVVRDLQRRYANGTALVMDRDLAPSLGKVIGMVDRPGMNLDLPLDVRGTSFQRRVWQALREIPSGTTASYAEVATRIGAPKSVRAVAQACAANAIAIAIPCHRVVKSDGALSGYRWGVARKRALLEREARA